MKKKQNPTQNTEKALRSRKNSNLSNAGSTGVVKKRQESSNKQNIIQITEPFYSSSLSYPTKEFVLSQQCKNLKSKSNLNDVNINANVMMNKKSRQMIREYDKEQELIERRLSLKCTNNYSQQDKQKSQRLSMTPIRKDTNGIRCAYPQTLADERQSFGSINQQYLIHSDSKLNNQIIKEAFITNFVNKIEHQFDLRTIIQSKLKNNSTELLSKNRKTQSNFSDFTEQNSSLIASKLKQCKNQIKYFKSVIREMSEKITEITQLKKISRISQKNQENNKNKSQDNVELFTALRKLGKQCHYCQMLNHIKKKQMSTQTIKNSQQQKIKRIKVNEPLDFVDHIDQTLQMLDYRKK